MPPEYALLKDLSPHEQIAGQIHYLHRFYERVLGELDDALTVRVHYAELCSNPAAVLDRVSARLADVFGGAPGVRRAPPASFGYRGYLDREAEKAALRSASRLSHELPARGATVEEHVDDGQVWFELAPKLRVGRGAVLVVAKLYPVLGESRPVVVGTSERPREVDARSQCRADVDDELVLVACLGREL